MQCDHPRPSSLTRTPTNPITHTAVQDRHGEEPPVRQGPRPRPQGLLRPRDGRHQGCALPGPAPGAHLRAGGAFELGLEFGLLLLSFIDIYVLTICIIHVTKPYTYSPAWPTPRRSRRRCPRWTRSSRRKEARTSERCGAGRAVNKCVANAKGGAAAWHTNTYACGRGAHHGPWGVLGV